MKNNYTFFGYIHLIISFLFTKVFYFNARIIRLPFFLRGKSSIKLGKNFTAGVGCRIECFKAFGSSGITIGDDVQINDYVHIACIDSVYIGNNVLIASKVFISDHNHGNFDNDFDFNSPPAKWELTSKSVCLKDNSWIGENVSILPGVNIGEYCIVGANSVVTNDLPSYSICAGVPAKVIKKYNFEIDRWERVNSSQNY